MVFLNKSILYKLSDNELVEAIVKEKDRNHLRQMQEELYNRYAKKIYTKCVIIVKERELSKDLTHDIIIKVLLNLSQFRSDSPFYSWVNSIVYNHCLNYIQKNKKIKLVDFGKYSYEIAIEEIEMENRILKELNLDKLEELMVLITIAERTILLMRYQDGMSIKQIAKTMNVGESAVKMRLKRSRDHLAELFKQLGHDK